MFSGPMLPSTPNYDLKLRIRARTMQHYIHYHFQVYLRRFWAAVAYSVEHMSVTHWMILGSLSVIVGIVMLRSTKR